MKCIGNRWVGDELLDAPRGRIAEVVQPRRAVAVLAREKLETPLEVDPRRPVDVVRPPDVHPGSHGWRNVGEGQPGRCQYDEAHERQGPDPLAVGTGRMLEIGHVP